MMINQIDQNIPFAGVKSEVIATHLKKFWTPRMRSEIFQAMNDSPDEYSQDVKDALNLLHQQAKA